MFNFEIYVHTTYDIPQVDEDLILPHLSLNIGLPTVTQFEYGVEGDIHNRLLN